MGLIVNTNVASLNAQRSIAASGVELKTAMERLSSGKKINSAADDAAGFAIAERMTAQIRGLNMAAKNASDGLSMIATVENATNDVTDMLQRIRELAVQAVNDTNSVTDRKYLNDEVQALITEITRVSDDTVYNKLQLLDGSSHASGKFQVGTESTQQVSFTFHDIGADAIGAHTTTSGVTTVVSGSALADINVLTGLAAESALDVISGAIEQVAAQRAEYGALQNRLEYTVSNLMNVAEWTNAARSRIEDADFAAESARLSKAQVLQQTGTAMLAQANAASQLALQLIR